MLTGVALAGLLLGFGGAVGVAGEVELGGRGVIEEVGDGGGDHVGAGRGGPVIEADQAQRLRFRPDPGQGVSSRRRFRQAATVAAWAAVRRPVE
ncbi:hypothetical protein [Streptosporangium sandarakinum]|uniref:Uncharacterized protein n=1 Tax=Streptosporangium sandarakinum TaxID=1260955 RepID=A0A852VBH2_9ACTN|nr:hypothetical protein [Streptosporangium sandarakinum]NYF44583.1 hypothetical protein [Streptosporangium sandarakinum]